MGFCWLFNFQPEGHLQSRQPMHTMAVDASSRQTIQSGLHSMHAHMKCGACLQVSMLQSYSVLTGLLRLYERSAHDST
jgi:hypothetical protein